MKNNEILDLIKLIYRVYKTDYAGSRDIVNDWTKVLKQYEFKDMTESLDYYMKNYSTYPPKVYDLIRGYKTIESKKLLETALTRCMFCGKVIKLGDTTHEDRCRSIEFIKSAVRRFKNQEIDLEKYKNMSDEEFNKYYQAAQKLIIENSTNQKEKTMLEEYLKKVEII
jgi:hypothetical protein